MPPSLHPSIASPLGDVTTERLDLRRFRASDLDALAEVFAIAEVWHFPFGRGFTRDETADFLNRQIDSWTTRGFGTWLAIERATRRVIGFVGLSVPAFLPEILPAVEVGWRLHPDVWGRGYAAEGARAAMREAFTTMGLDDICSLPQATNPASLRVCERIGMRREREVIIPPTDRRGAVAAILYRMTAAEWRSRRSEAS